MNKQAYFKLMGLNKKAENVTPEQDKRYTSSVNALAALLGTTGIGTSLVGGSRAIGGSITGAGIGTAAGYHLARLLKANKKQRFLSSIFGGIGGGIAGGLLGKHIDKNPTEQRGKLVGQPIDITGDIRVEEQLPVRISNRRVEAVPVKLQ